MSAAVVGPSADHRPARPLLPAPWARLAGFAALVALGALQWRRMVEGLPATHALLWVAVACATAVAVLAAERLAPRRRAVAVLGVAVAALAGVGDRVRDPARPAPAPAELARARRGRGRRGGDPRRRAAALRGGGPVARAGHPAGGALLCATAALLAFWPLPGGVRGYPFLALAVLLALVATPVVATAARARWPWASRSRR